MYYHYPYTAGSAYVLWQRFIIGKKIGIAGIRLWRKKRCDNPIDLSRTYFMFGKDGILYTCSRIGDLSIVRFLVQEGCDPTSGHNLAILLASQHGQLHIVKWLYSVGCVLPFSPIQMASRNGHLNVVKWLYRIGWDLAAYRDWAIVEASEGGHLKLVKWLYRIAYYPTDRDDLAIQRARKNGHLHVVDWIEKHVKK